MKKGNTMVFFQKLSKAFLTPLSLIASASLLMGVASFFTSGDIIAAAPFLGNTMVQYIFKVLLQMGSIVVSNFAALYAVALPFALVDEDKEYAAFAGFVGYLSFLTGMGMLVDNFPNIAAMFPGNGLTTVLGISTVNAGMLGGILVGILTSVLHKKFHTLYDSGKSVPLRMGVYFPRYQWTGNHSESDGRLWPVAVRFCRATVDSHRSPSDLDFCCT